MHKVLDKLNMMNTRLNVDQLPSSQDLGLGNFSALSPISSVDRRGYHQSSVGSGSVSARHNVIRKKKSQHKHSSSLNTGTMNASGRNFSSKSAQLNFSGGIPDSMSI